MEVDGKQVEDERELEDGKLTGPGFRVSPGDGPVRDQVVTILKHALLSGRFEPGQRLTEKSLCEWTGASRPALREGLRQLEAEGLIVIAPNRGPSVASLDQETARQVYDVRTELEAYLARLAAQSAGPAEVAQMRAALIRLSDTAESGDILGIVAAKITWNEVLFSLSRNTELNDVIRQLNTRLRLIWPRMEMDQDNARSVVADVTAITDAIANRDQDAAEAAMRAFNQRSMRVMLAFLAPRT